VLANTSYLPPGKTYNRDEHFDLEWADAVLRGLYVILIPGPAGDAAEGTGDVLEKLLTVFDYHRLVLFETPGQPLCGTHRGEGWYTSNVWSLVLHKCLLSLPYMNLEW
jgi:hypothetical protein